MKKHNEDQGNGGNFAGNNFSGEHERLCAYLLGELDAAETKAMQESLESDANLRGQRDRLAATIGLVTENCSASESLSPAILETLERAATPVLSTKAWTMSAPLRMAAGLAAIVTGVMAGRALMQPEAPLQAEDVASIEEEQQLEPATLALRDAKPADQPVAGRPLDRDGKSDLLAKNAPSEAREATSSSPEAGIYRGPDNCVPPSSGGEQERLAQGEALERQRKDRDLAQELHDASQPEATRRNRVEAQTLSLDAAELTLDTQTAAKPVKTSGVLVALVDKATASPPATESSTRSQLEALGYIGQKMELRGQGASGGNPIQSGPASPGPSGPSAPGSVSLSVLPAPNQTPRTGVSSVSSVDGRVSGSRARKQLKLRPELAGVFDTQTGQWTRSFSEQATGGSDDFFLGRGQKARPQLSPEQLYDYRTRSIFDDCIRLPNEKPKDMFFRFWGDNAFELTQVDSQSTFSVDVDTASYTLARRYLNEGKLPTKEQIRTEEFLNYFKPDLPAPTEDVFGIYTELAPSRFGNAASAPSQRWLLRVGVRGQEIALQDRKALTLTFVVDTSGSMKEGQRLELVKHALRLLVAQLDAGDSIAIVSFNNSASLVLPMTSAQNRGIIEAALYGLTPGGGTNAEGGLRFGYEVAAAALSTEAHNRVVFLSDGVANIGQVNQDRLNESIRERRESGIYLNTIGVGMSNHNDTFLEQLADKGDGICNYVDSAAEARRALVDNFTGAFQPIARDVKLQVEFDPSQVYRYRLLGYENRAIADADFRNDAVDAGELGAGHQVLALYELELTGSQSEEPLAQVNLRWKAPSGSGRDPLEDQATERNQPVLRSSGTAWEGTSLGYRRSALVAQFAEILRRSVHARGDSLDELIAESLSLAPHLQDADFTEFVQLLQRSRELILRHAPIENDLSNCIDSLRHNRILRAQLKDLRRTENQQVLGQLERNNAELEAKIRDLIRAEIEKQPR